VTSLDTASATETTEMPNITMTTPRPLQLTQDGAFCCVHAGGAFPVSEPLKAALAAPLSFAPVPQPSPVNKDSSKGYHAAPPRAAPRPGSPPPIVQANDAGDFIVSDQRWAGGNVEFMKSNQHSRDRNGKWDTNGLCGARPLRSCPPRFRPSVQQMFKMTNNAKPGDDVSSQRQVHTQTHTISVGGFPWAASAAPLTRDTPSAQRRRRCW
jgi:hypothetical protein